MSWVNEWAFFGKDSRAVRAPIAAKFPSTLAPIRPLSWHIWLVSAASTGHDHP
jgi:hypothetical protein